MWFIVAKNSEHTIKLLYPIETDRRDRFQNEIDILTILKEKFQDKLLENGGIVDLIDSGYAKLEILDEDERLRHCFVIVYTYGIPLFPILRRCVKYNNRKMLFWFFSQMVSAKTNV